MTQDPHIPRQEQAPEADVVQWGESTGSPPYRGTAGRLLHRIRRRGQVAKPVAGLGAVAVFGSLLADWLTSTAIAPGPTVEDRTLLRLGVTDLGALGSGYLMGALGLVVLTALSLAGQPAVRHTARIAALATSAWVLAVLVATVVTIRTEGRPMSFSLDPEQMRVEHGSGLTFAVAGAALLGLAALVGADAPVPTRTAAAGQLSDSGAPERDADASERDGGPAADGRGGSGRRGGWRQAAADSAEPPGPAPIDLTVAPTTPFLRPGQDN